MPLERMKEPHIDPSPDSVPPADQAAAETSSPPAGDVTPPELEQVKDRLLRLQADFDNYRRRSLREKSEWSVTANESLIRELLPVVDHFELGLKTAQERPTEDAVRDGFRLVHEQLMGVLKRAGLQAVDVHEASFDPHLHEAVAQVPSAEQPVDAIVAQTRRGWKLGDKLLRPVQVILSSGPGAPRDDEVQREPASTDLPKEA